VAGLRPCGRGFGLHFTIGDAFNQLCNGQAHARVGRSHIGLENAQSAGLGEQMDRGIQAGRSIRGGFEQLADRNAKDGSDLRQPAGANPVRALLVFLLLLKGNADLFREQGAYTYRGGVNPAAMIAFRMMIGIWSNAMSWRFSS